MRRRVVLLLAAMLLGGCGSSHPRSSVVAGGCGITTLHRGSGPAWTAPSAPSFLPYAVAEGGTAAGFIFGYPLRAGNPGNPANKILWIVRQPGSGLVIRASPLRSKKPVVTVRLDDSAGPEIYPSYVDVPTAGCWHISLHWAGHADSLDLAYRTAA